MSKSKIFIGISICFALGIFLGSVLDIPNSLVYISLAVLISFFAIFFLSHSLIPRLAVFFLICCALGILRMNFSQKPNEYQNYFDSKEQLEGHIVEDVDVRQDKQMLTIKPKGFDQNILVTTSLSDHYFYGDWVVVEGKITEPKNFSGFDYLDYLTRFNIYAVSSYPKVLILKNHQQNFFKEALLRLKAAFVQQVGRFLPEPKASLLLAILIGAKKTLPPDIINNFNRTGTSHMIAISGFNITIIVYALAFLTRFLGRKISFWIVVPIIIAFVILSGASASIIRAAIMGILLLIATLSGRQYGILPSLFFAALVMLLFNPKILVFDVGFQLSFMATLGIVCFMPLLEKLTNNIDSFFGLKETFLATMAAIVSTLPFILFYFGTLSLVAPLANLLILPLLLPASMLFGFLIIIPLLGAGFAFVANIILSIILWLEKILGNWHYSSLNIVISGWIFCGLCLAVLAVYFFLRRWALRKTSVTADS